MHYVTYSKLVVSGGPYHLFQFFEGSLFYFEKYWGQILCAELFEFSTRNFDGDVYSARAHKVRGSNGPLHITYLQNRIEDLNLP